MNVMAFSGSKYREQAAGCGQARLRPPDTFGGVPFELEKMKVVKGVSAQNTRGHVLSSET